MDASLIHYRGQVANCLCRHVCLIDAMVLSNFFLILCRRALSRE